jgi:hypothetical protein
VVLLRDRACVFLEGLLALGDQALFSVKRAGRGGIAAAGARRRTGR